MEEKKEIKISRKKLVIIIIAAVACLAAALAVGIALGRGSSDTRQNEQKPQQTENETAGSGVEEREALTEGVEQSAYTVIADDNVYWGYETGLFCAPLDETGAVGAMKKESEFPQKLRQMILSGDDLYCNFEDGIYHFDLKNKGTGTRITSKTAYDGFWLADRQIYFCKDETVYCVPAAGGIEQEIASGVLDYAVTSAGIFYLNEKGTKMYQMDLNGEGVTEVAQTENIRSVTPFGNFLFLKGDDLWTYDPVEKQKEKLGLSEKIEKDGDVLVTDQFVIYDGISGETRQYYLESRKDIEKKYISNVEKPYSVQYKNNLYYSFNSGELTRMTLDTFEKQKTDAEEYMQQAVSENTPTADTPSDSSGDYNIGSNLIGKVSNGTAFVQSDYFYLALNYDDYADGLWEYEVVNPTTISFYYTKARKSGNGGHVVTIEAFDWGDNGYEQYPAYAVAGLSETKKYIAVFPTDVQYDLNSAQQRNEYERLRKFADRIDQNRADNPFSASQE